MAQFVDNPWPTSLELPRLQEPRPRYNGLKNLRYGPGTGRTKGVQNKICRDLKEGLLQSAILHGYDGAGQGGLVGFCLHLAKRHPKVHGGLLAKLLPYNLSASVAGPAITSVNVVSIPSGCHLTPEQVELAERGKAFTLDPGQISEQPPAPPLPEAEHSDDGQQLLDAIAMLARQVGALVDNQ